MIPAPKEHSLLGRVRELFKPGSQFEYMNRTYVVIDVLGPGDGFVLADFPRDLKLKVPHDGKIVTEHMEPRDTTIHRREFGSEYFAMLIGRYEGVHASVEHWMNRCIAEGRKASSLEVEAQDMRDQAVRLEARVADLLRQLDAANAKPSTENSSS